MISKVETITGKVSKIIFTSQKDDSNYTICKISCIKTDSIFTVKGNFCIKENEIVEFWGKWVKHPRYGLQFQANYYTLPNSENLAGISAALASIPGINTNLANAIVEKFGTSFYAILEISPKKLLSIKGIGKRKLKSILDFFEKNKPFQELISFLETINISLAYANKIYDVFGKESLDTIKTEPYILSKYIHGIGFHKNDEIALKLGILPNSKQRITAAIQHILNEATFEDGHCFLPINILIAKTIDLLTIPYHYTPQKELIIQTIYDLNLSQIIHINEKNHIYLQSLWNAEREVANRIKKFLISTYSTKTHPKFLELWIKDFEKKHQVQLDKQQKNAIIMANEHSFMIITGGAGCGKSLTAKAIYHLWLEQGLKIAVCAPTGRATQRLKESINIEEAYTIHRLLKFNGHSFIHDTSNPLKYNAYIIDEGAMIDILLFHKLLQAIPLDSHVCIIGDHHQLPPVNPGIPFFNLIQTNSIPKIYLNKIFRQDNSSKIIPCSLNIRKGIVPRLDEISGNLQHDKLISDTLFLPAKTEYEFEQAILYLINDFLPHYGFTQNDIQILCPMNKNKLGNNTFNLLVQKSWNYNQVHLNNFRIQDRIIQNTNNYNLNLFNGDIGIIQEVNLSQEYILAKFGDQLIKITKKELEDVKLAYSISIHKAQGSEFPVVIIPITTSHAFMLNRNLLYTGFTRAKKLVILVGQLQALHLATQKTHSYKRYTNLTELLNL